MIKYVLIWIGLVALTIATFLISRLPTGHWSVAIALVIASTKASLIVLFFMELAKHRGGSAIVFGTSFVFVAVLLTFALFDVGLRFQPTRIPGPFARPLEPNEKPLDPMKRYDPVPVPRGGIERPVKPRE